ncbi:MAG: thermonuclease family protein [Paracoccaceae bacterium]
MRGRLPDLDANLLAYVALTLLMLVAVADWLAPVPPAGAGCGPGYVYDGDTVEMICPDATGTARLIGLDTPELKGRCPEEIRAAEAARRHLAALVKAAGERRIEIAGRDKYGRALIRLWLDGRDAAALMLAAGHGRPYHGERRAGWCG